MAHQCHSAPRSTKETKYITQNGWQDIPATDKTPASRIPIYVEVPFTMTLECRYDASMRDPICVGCPHINEAINV